MLRVLVFEEPFSVKLRVEGKLTSDSAAVLTERWADVHSNLRGRRAILDLGDVAELDEAGRAALRSLANAGAQLGYAHPKVRSAVDAVAEEAQMAIGTAARWKALYNAARQRWASWRHAWYARISALLPATARSGRY